MAGQASTTHFPPMNRFSDGVPPESPAARSALLAEMIAVSGEGTRLAEAGLEALAALEAGTPLAPARMRTPSPQTYR
jgi:hypothetical protein